MTDPFDAVAAVADAVLYEGYLLYPYRASAQKNRVRWQWGVLMPSECSASGTSIGTAHGADAGEVSRQRVEALLEPSGDAATLRIRVRFLHQERRALLDAAGREVPELAVGDTRHLAFDEGVPTQVDADLTVAALRDGVTVPITLAASRTVEELAHPDGTRVGTVVRTREPVTATATLSATEIPGPYATLRLELVVRNWSAALGSTRDEGLRTAMIGTHTLLAVCPGSFVSPTDPPEWARPLVAECATENAWPALAGDDDRSDLLLVSPIILGDHARIAPESGIDLFDGCENDEILTLRTLALTDAEKAEARATDPRAAEIIDAVEALPPEMMDRLHGAIRSLRGPTGAPPDTVPTFVTPASNTHPNESAVRAVTCDERAVRSVGSGPPAASTPWWDPAADATVDPETDSVLVGDVPVARGSAVVLRPGRDAGGPGGGSTDLTRRPAETGARNGAGTGIRSGSAPPGRRTDAQDAFLDGMRATVQAVVHDVDGGVHVAVSVDDDPAAELQLAHGRFRYFRPDELEPFS